MKYGWLFRLGVLLLTVVLAAGWSTQVSAAPAAPIDHIITQPDGTTFTARQWGDEWLNGYETEAGHTILQDSDGWWVYALAAEDGSLAPAAQESVGRLVVGIADPNDLPLHMRPQGSFAPPDALPNGIDTANVGTQPTLVLLASFSDRAGTYTAANFASSIFGATNSVKDFYLKASFNKLTLAQATESHGTANDGVIGWLNLGYAHPNTGSNTGNANQLIVKNALIAADSYINYAAYDTNSDGYISLNELHIVVVVAGFERSYGTSTPNIWAHRWTLDYVTPPTLDGKVLGQGAHKGGYAQFGEIHGDHQATIGIMAHELGHDLTWPDLYDTDDSSEGVGNWSIMGGGSWNRLTGANAGSTPALPDAWLKWYQTWITPSAVNGTLTGVSIPQAATNASAFLLRPNPGGVNWNFNVASGTGEFFLVENRQLTGYDAALPGCGLAIWHIDESVTYTNSANANENHPLVKLMEADGLNNLHDNENRGDTGDPFPGSTTNRTFNSTSNPNSNLYSGGASQAAATNISNCAATMTANLTYGTGPVAGNKVFMPVIIRAFVNSLPVANAQSVSTVKNTAKAITLTATDANGDPLTYIIVSNPAHGTLSGTGASRTYTPATNYVGSDSFTFKANDGHGDSNVATVSISVTASGVRNGTFEDGRDGNWTESSTGGWELITQSFPGNVTPHGGDWAAWLGGDDDETSRLTQTGISMSGVRYLHYWYWIASEEISCGYDFAKIFVNNVEKQSFNLCPDTNTSGWVQGTLDLNSYAGTSISLEFRATTDSSYNSNFFVDDVSISAALMTEPDDVRQLSGTESNMK